MAIVKATKAGNWTDPTVWDTGTVPTAADDVYSNGFIVTLNPSGNTTAKSISNAATTGVTAGGYFQISALTVNVTLTFDVYMGTLSNLRITAATTVIVDLVGNIYGANTNGQYTVQTVNANVYLRVTGNIYGSSTGSVATIAFALFQNGGHNSRPLTINGDVYMGVMSGTINTSGCVVINGNVRHNAAAVQANNSIYRNACAYDFTVNGDVYGYESSVTPISSSPNTIRVLSGSTGNFTVNGNVYGGAFGGARYAISMESTGVTFRVNGRVVALASNAIYGFTTPLIAKYLEHSSTGVTPVQGNFKMSNVADIYIDVYDESGSLIRFKRTDTSGGTSPMPAPSDVRLGVDYNGGDLTGTCAVPLQGYVKEGIAVDHALGILEVFPSLESVWDTIMPTTPVAGSYGEKLKGLSGGGGGGGTDPWETVVPSTPTAGTYGALVKANINPWKITSESGLVSGTFGDLVYQMLTNGLQNMNEGIQNASLLIPYSQDIADFYPS